MKALAAKLAVVTTVALISSVPVLAAETGMDMNNGEGAQKDQCLLVARTCNDNVDSLQQRIDKLNHEISKGTSVYTQEELRKLRFELKDATDTLAVLMRGGA